MSEEFLNLLKNYDDCIPSASISSKELIAYVESLELENLQLKEKIRWIPVEERLPEVGEFVLVAEKKGGITESFVDFEDYETRDGIEWFGADEVTHWMPLPEPPEVE